MEKKTTKKNTTNSVYSEKAMTSCTKCSQLRRKEAYGSTDNIVD